MWRLSSQKEKERDGPRPYPPEHMGPAQVSTLSYLAPGPVCKKDEMIVDLKTKYPSGFYYKIPADINK